MKTNALKTLMSAIDFGKKSEDFDEIVDAIYTIEDAFFELDALSNIDKMLKDQENEEFKAFSRIATRAYDALMKEKKSSHKEYGNVYTIDKEFWQLEDDITLIQNAIYQWRSSFVMTEGEREQLDKENEEAKAIINKQLGGEANED